MTLALRLGKTLAELTSSLDVSELRMWMAYDKMSPISDRRGDINTAMIASAVLNAAGVKVSVSELVPVWDQNAANEEAESNDPFEAWLSGMSE
ncbi:DUF4035 domain-containing protein [Providencia manganoxydans]|uniref:phage tail assembly protein T n=1 Tax=Providencia manganoxydans TaxID=2923283 RepID=UPI0034E5489A